MADIFHEVEEDLRREKFDALWRKYGPWLVAIAVGFVAVVAALLWWADYTEKQQADRSDQFLAATELLEAGKAEEGLAALDALIAGDAGGYLILSELKKAAELSKSGDNAGAVAVYEALAGSGNGGAILADLAAVKAGWLVVETEDLQSVQARLSQVAAGDGPWSISAKEIIAYGAFRSGDLELSRDLYTEILRTQRTTVGTRGRAGEMLSIILPQVGESHEGHAHAETAAEAPAEAEAETEVQPVETAEPAAPETADQETVDPESGSKDVAPSQ